MEREEVDLGGNRTYVTNTENGWKKIYQLLFLKFPQVATNSFHTGRVFLLYLNFGMEAVFTIKVKHEDREAFRFNKIHKFDFNYANYWCLLDPR